MMTKQIGKKLYWTGIRMCLPMDLGRTDVMEHTIQTGDARPIKLAPRRTPRAFVEEEEKLI